MSVVLVTGSTEGLGRATATALLDQSHEVVVHARNAARQSAVQPLLDRGARIVVGDLGDLDEVHGIAEQVAGLGAVDAVIHNAGVMSGPDLLTVNVVAPYLLTALLPSPARQVYLSSSMHRGGRPDLAAVDWLGRPGDASYPDSKLLITAVSNGVARRRSRALVNAVDPGWVPTRMGGPSAPDDLELGHVTQAWLAVSDDPEALTSGGYWHHRRRKTPAALTLDEQFQETLLTSLAAATGLDLR